MCRPWGRIILHVLVSYTAMAPTVFTFAGKERQSTVTSWRKRQLQFIASVCSYHPSALGSNTRLSEKSDSEPGICSYLFLTVSPQSMPSFPTSHHSVPGKSSQRHGCLLTSLSTEFLTRLLFYLQEAQFEQRRLSPFSGIVPGNLS